MMTKKTHIVESDFLPQDSHVTGYLIFAFVRRRTPHDHRFDAAARVGLVLLSGFHRFLDRERQVRHGPGIGRVVAGVHLDAVLRKMVEPGMRGRDSVKILFYTNSDVKVSQSLVFYPCFYHNFNLIIIAKPMVDIYVKENRGNCTIGLLHKATGIREIRKG